MNDRIQDKSYFLVCKIAAWGGLLFAIPAHIYRVIRFGGNWTDGLVILLYFYLTVSCYIYGYRALNPPSWSKYFVRQKWINDVVAIAKAPRDDARNNKMGLLLLVLASALLAFAVLHGFS
jgi:hypothetical protein